MVRARHHGFTSTMFRALPLVVAFNIASVAEFCRASHWPVPQEVAQQSVRELISQLDSAHFRERESATEKLGKLSGNAIDELAMGLLSGTPEKTYRIKRALESICTSGSEEEFYRCASILKLRFGANDKAIATRLNQLKAKWRQELRKRSIQELERLGMQIVDSTSPPSGITRITRLNAGVFEPPEDQPKTNRQPLSKKAMREALKEILAADVDENRDRVFEDGDADPAQQVQTDSRDDLRMQLLLRQQMMANQQNFNVLTQRGVSITVPKGFELSEAATKLLKRISPITELKFVSQDIDDQLVDYLNIATGLSRVTFEDCRFDESEWKDAAWPNRLGQMEFQRCVIDEPLVKQMSRLKILQFLAIDDCQVEESAISALKSVRGLKTIQLSNMNVDEGTFRGLSNLKNLSFLRFTAVKFDGEDYSQFVALRPKVQVVFTARAFLGVRGPVNGGLDDPGCTISDVIPNSGAADAGMRVGDVIKEVNGQVVRQFEDLRLHIAQHLPGDSLQLKIQRGNKALTLKVELKDVESAPKF